MTQRSTWDKEEIEAVCQHTYSRPSREARPARWNGIPRYVLQITDSTDSTLVRLEIY